MSRTEDTDETMRLDLFANPEFRRGASRPRELAWVVVSGLLVAGWLPGSGWRRALLRLFGARIGAGVVIKPRVTVKFPWKLEIGDHAWIGEAVWIDNLAPVTIGAQCCVSQGAYLCTGNHDWSDLRFGLVVRPITLETGCWVGAQARLAPGAHLEEGAVVTLGSTAAGRLAARMVHAGTPARPVGPRRRRPG
jgi:putative colanic acid biosynthesis acetyltransferase WcaF